MEMDNHTVLVFHCGNGTTTGDRGADSRRHIGSGKRLAVFQIVDLSGSVNLGDPDIDHAEPLDRERIGSLVEEESSAAPRISNPGGDSSAGKCDLCVGLFVCNCGCRHDDECGYCRYDDDRALHKPSIVRIELWHVGRSSSLMVV